MMFPLSEIIFDSLIENLTSNYDVDDVEAESIIMSNQEIFAPVIVNLVSMLTITSILSGEKRYDIMKEIKREIDKKVTSYIG